MHTCTVSIMRICIYGHADRTKKYEQKVCYHVISYIAVSDVHAQSFLSSNIVWALRFAYIIFGIVNFPQLLKRPKLQSVYGRVLAIRNVGLL